MVLLDRLRNWLGNRWVGAVNTASTAVSTITTTLSTPVVGTGGIVDRTPAALKPVLIISEAEKTHQRAILDARKYDSGLHDVKLTARLKEFLGDDCGPAALRLNFIHKINGSIASRLLLESFQATSDNETEQTNQIQFADAVWQGSRMKGKRARMLLDAIRDGEHFLMVDFDRENARPRFTPHQRYTDPMLGGDGEGVFMRYPNDDSDQKPLYAVKRWAEQIQLMDGSVRPEPRISIYYENHIERYAERSLGWIAAPLDLPDGSQLPDFEWNTDSGTPDGNALGIPFVHIKTPTLEPAAREAIPIQKGLNKTYLDMLAASDMEAFRVLVALGWEPPDTAIEPGTWMWAKAQAGEQLAVHEITPTDSTRFIELIDKQIALMADVTDTPLTLLQRSAQRAAEGTLQEEKESFIAKVRDYAETIEMALEDALKLARRLHNAFGGLIDGNALALDETPDFSVVWQPFATRTVEDKAAESVALQAVGVPDETIWRNVWKFSEEEIQSMQKTKEAAIAGDGFKPRPPPAATGAPNGTAPNTAVPASMAALMNQQTAGAGGA